jgi:chaperone required for assembly of F1-ATPase
MRDLLNDLDAGRFLSDPDPVRRAQKNMRTPLPKRFYGQVEVARGEGGFRVLLDGRPVRTPGAAVLEMPTYAAAELVAREFAAQKEFIEPATMPATRLANTVVDGVASDPQAVLEDVLRYAGSDLVCYRADAPEGLVARQSEAWDPVLDWARAAIGARLVLAEGVMHVAQPPQALGAIGAHLAARRDPWRIAALHLMTSIGGSALVALAVDAGALDGAAAWAAVNVDEEWNASQWGDDAEAAVRQSARQSDFMAAVALLESLARP